MYINAAITGSVTTLKAAISTPMFPTTSRRAPVGDRPISIRFLAWLALALLLGLAGPARAQEALRSSLAGEAAARARKSTENLPYNIKMGPVRLRFAAGLNVEYNDNINVAEGAVEQDIVLRPEGTIDAAWPVTPQNTINVRMGIGYSKFFNRSENDSLLITPGSIVSFDVFVGDVKFNLHDRFSYYQNPLQEGSVSGTNGLRAASYGTAQNAIGLSADWDLNRIIASGGFDHVSTFATSDTFSYLDQSSDYFFVRGAFLINEALTLGLEATTGFTTYDQPVLNDSVQYSLGSFATWQVSQYMQAAVRGGYVIYSFDDSGTIVTNATNTSSFYASLNVDHRVNQYISHSLGAGYQISLGVNSDALKLLFIRHAANWRLVRLVDIQTDIFWERGEEAGSMQPETFSRLGASIGVSYKMTEHLTTGLRYAYTSKDSELAGRDYSVNTVTLLLQYAF